MTNITIVPLCELENGQEADVFALLSEKEPMKTREGKPYLRVVFRDSLREIRFPIWSDLGIYQEFKDLAPGTFCKLRAVYRIGTFGPQLDLRRIRPVTEEDRKDGFDPLMLRPRAPFSLEAMFEQLQTISAKQLGKSKLRQLVIKILKEHRTLVMTCTAARHHHHCYVGGLLEHTLSVVKIAVGLVDHYHAMYPDRVSDFSRELVVAGAILHDIGKIREYEPELGAMHHSTEGALIGHTVLGRDIVRESAQGIEIAPALLLRLEHIILAHQRYPEWGAPKPPMSLEAMLVHHADSCDAMVGCCWNTFAQDQTGHELTGSKNVLGYPLLRPGEKKDG